MSRSSAPLWSYALRGAFLLLFTLFNLWRTSPLEAWQVALGVVLAGVGVIDLVRAWQLWSEKAESPLPKRLAVSSNTVIASLLLTLTTLLFGFTLVFTPALNVWNVTQARSWPQTTAQVTSASFSRSRCLIQYTYTVNGTPFTGDRIDFESMGGGRQSDPACQHFQNRPAPRTGDQIQVHYNPQRPAQAVYLTATPAFSLRILKVVGVFLVMLGGVWFWRKRQRSSSGGASGNPL